MKTPNPARLNPGAHCYIHPNANIGTDVTIDSHVSISVDVDVGSNTSIGTGTTISRNVRIGKSVKIDPRVIFAPPNNLSSSSERTIVQDGAVIGAGAILVSGITIGTLAQVKPGAVVTRSVPPTAIVDGNPAMIVGYVDTHRATLCTPPLTVVKEQAGVETTAVKGVTTHKFPIITDLRGHLTVGEFEKQIPFRPLRYFMVYGVPNKEIRGEHAHLECHQFLICVRGSCAAVADDGAQRIEVVLDSPNLGLYLPPMTWGVQYKSSSDALLLVFASHHYDASDYIRDYSEFQSLILKNKSN